MEYKQGKLGRTFVVRFDDGEDLIEELKILIKKEQIKAGNVQLIGAISSGKAVLGPHKREYPPNPFWWEFDDAREIIALGIFAFEGDEPKIHLHSGIGHSSESKIGCIRETAKVYITVEVIIQEIVNSGLIRKLDKRYNASLLDFED